uniref:Uncharacterized protein n=1 Tax=Avena sativa TaxID=4498 RepID=A0ACD5TZW0_AVESA
MDPVETEAARRRQEKENSAIQVVHLLVWCAICIQAGDYAAAAGILAEARATLATTVSTDEGIGRVMSHFAAALAQRLFPASSSNSGAAAVDAASSADHARELYRQFYEAGPYLMFAHFTANQAILEAFEGCDRVHVIDLAIMTGAQWPAFIQTLACRPGGPPSLRITGVGSRYALHEVGTRLAETALAVNVPFSFCGVTVDTLDELQPWMFPLVPGEALAVNSICHLHRLLVDPDASASTYLSSPIDAVLGLVAAMQPRVFTVVEQEAYHNKPTLVERLINGLFYYSAMFDSMEALPTDGRAGAEAYLQREIFDIVCGEGSSRAERHEPLDLWRARLWLAGLAQVPIGPSATWWAASLVRAFSGACFHVEELAGCLTLVWDNQPLFTASVWRAEPTTSMLPGE